MKITKKQLNALIESYLEEGTKELPAIRHGDIYTGLKNIFLKKKALLLFTKGKLGFAKIVLSSDSSVSSLVTINLFDSDLTSLGIGSFKTTLSSGESEMTLSFFIPNDAEFGNGDIYANVFSDWPSQGGVPLTGESAIQVRIQ